ncbi:3-deoxy-manno-octulosonate cytidylyltransferase [Pararhizobium haloflavum]|uniref:3-deoxy-manno-octulosonate cytidylyltransferase n=1 Tax=Pararhizobium haloflavum TaxID=2037914 RepID=UPI000C186EF3|nr:3-deoxy-manno-octulosonate cytidylyltransferase [Pararhizobium haloflavum]
MTARHASQTIVLIPARMASTRLPGKPLADIAGRPMIVQVAARAREADIGRVVVATDSAEVAEAVRAAGFEAVMTRADHRSGSDRVAEALATLDPDGTVSTVVNLQGDLPTIEPRSVAAALVPLGDSAVDIATLCVEIKDAAERTNPNVVKVVGSPIGADRLRALYFTRATAPHGDGPLYHHVGIYAYRRKALQRFVDLAPSVLEQRESLEQLRALEDGMRIDAAIVEAVPLGVDTPDDLEKARDILGKTHRNGQ